MNKKIFRVIFALFVIAIAATIGTLGEYRQEYLSSQVNIFLTINHALAVFGKEFWKNMTAYGDALVLLPALSFLILYNTKAWASLIASIPFASLSSGLAKWHFSMPRPASVLDADKLIIIGKTLKGATSLPSGHTITVFTAVAAIMFTYPLWQKQSKYSKLFIFGLPLFAVLVALSRVAVGAHWPFDTLLGMALGIFSGFCGSLLATKFTAWWSWMYRGYGRYIHTAILFMLSIAMMAKYPHLYVAWVSLAISSFVLIRLARNHINEK